MIGYLKLRVQTSVLNGEIESTKISMPDTDLPNKNDLEYILPALQPIISNTTATSLYWDELGTWDNNNWM